MSFVYTARIFEISKAKTMIYLTFYHGRNIFRGQDFVTWIRELFPSAKFEGFEYGHYLPTISVSLKEFESAKDRIPVMNLIRIEGRFSTLQQLVYGVRDFKNEISEKTENALVEYNK